MILGTGRPKFRLLTLTSEMKKVRYVSKKI